MSPVLPKLLPLFEPINDAHLQPVRSIESREGIQLLWEQGAKAEPHFEQLCLTLSIRSLSLTVAINHHHASVPDGVIPLPKSEEKGLVRSTLFIEGASHTLFKTNNINGTSQGIYRDHEAVEKFTPELTHALAVLGLYNHSQERRLKVS